MKVIRINRLSYRPVLFVSLRLGDIGHREGQAI